MPGGRYGPCGLQRSWRSPRCQSMSQWTGCSFLHPARFAPSYKPVAKKKKKRDRKTAINGGGVNLPEVSTSPSFSAYLYPSEAQRESSFWQSEGRAKLSESGGPWLDPKSVGK